MRAHGPLYDLPEAGGTTDHVCWVYGDDDDFDAVVHRFLADGLARGERLVGLGDRVIESVRSGEAPFDRVEGLVAAGTLQLLSLAEASAATGGFSAVGQREFYDAATRRAIEDGYRGLRVVAEVSGWASAPERRLELVRWEQLADDYVVHGAGMTATCAYRAELAPEALFDVASVHPLTRAPERMPLFQVFFSPDRTMLTGSVDTFGAHRLARVLDASPVTGPVAVLDVRLLEFVDVAGARVLACWARDLAARGLALQLTGASRLLRRMWQILALDRIAPVTFAEPRP